MLITALAVGMLLLSYGNFVKAEETEKPKSYYLNYKVPSNIASRPEYKTAVTQGEKLLKLNDSYIKAINAGDLDGMNEIFDQLSKQEKVVREKIYYVLKGDAKGTVNHLHYKYNEPAAISIQRTMYEISQYRHMLNMWNTLFEDPDYIIDNDIIKLQRLKNSTKQYKEGPPYYTLPASINIGLREFEAEINGENLDMYVANYEDIISQADIFELDLLYDDITNYLKKTEISIGQVPSKPLRKELNEYYIRPAKIVVERTKYEISQLRLMDKISDLIEKGNIDKAKLEFAKLERLKARAIEIKNTGGYKALPQLITTDLQAYEDEIKNHLFNQ